MTYIVGCRGVLQKIKDFKIVKIINFDRPPLFDIHLTSMMNDNSCLTVIFVWSAARYENRWNSKSHLANRYTKPFNKTNFFLFLKWGILPNLIQGEDVMANFDGVLFLWKGPAKSPVCQTKKQKKHLLIEVQ